MAAPAVAAKAAVVGVVARMAIATLFGQLHLIGRLDVTGFARDLRVRALQRKMRRLAMIKLPELPAIGVVAGSAGLA